MPPTPYTTNYFNQKGDTNLDTDFNLNQFEQNLFIKAEITKTPISGAIELLPLCNMDCKMCYIKLTKTQMEKQGQILSADKFLDFAKQLREMGTLFILLTGGEPLLYPEFKKLYKELKKMGFVIVINTNATLIDENWAEFFSNDLPRRLNITLYGASDETYKALCNNPRGFTQVMNAVKLLKKNNIPVKFNITITPDNIHDYEKILQIAENLQIPVQLAHYMFPDCRCGLEKNSHENRFSPREAAEVFVKRSKTEKAPYFEDFANNYLNKIAPKDSPEPLPAFGCRSSVCGFWINWKGELSPCGIINKPSISIVDNTVDAAWKYLQIEIPKLKKSSKCSNCDKYNVCRPCAAMAYAETGKFDKTPKYLCEMTDYTIEEIKKALDKN